MNKDQVMSLLRWLLTIAGAFLAQRGYVDASGWSEMAGGILAIAMAAWSMVFHGGVNKSDAVSFAGGQVAVEKKVEMRDWQKSR